MAFLAFWELLRILIELFFLGKESFQEFEFYFSKCFWLGKTKNQVIRKVNDYCTIQFFFKINATSEYVHKQYA